MKKGSMMIAGILLLTMLMGCGRAAVQNPPVIKNDGVVAPREQKALQEKMRLGDLENVFGFADESGKRLITVSNENGGELENPQAFNLAVGNNGEIRPIAFVKRQEANDRDTFRQTIYNFDNMAGYIYEATDGEFIQNKTYLLTTDTAINEKALIPLKSTRNTEATATTTYKEADGETLQKIEALKNRKIRKSSLISETAEGAKIGVFVFERQGDDMLASIGYVKGDTVIFKDYPAKYDEMSTWRVDAGDEPGLFEVLFLADSDEGLLLGMTWAAPEGESAYILKEANGVFEQTDLKSGRYWAP